LTLFTWNPSIASFTIPNYCLTLLDTSTYKRSSHCLLGLPLQHYLLPHSHNHTSPQPWTSILGLTLSALPATSKCNHPLMPTAPSHADWPTSRRRQRQALKPALPASHLLPANGHRNPLARASTSPPPTISPTQSHMDRGT
jgi:hypothetical protein